MGAWIGLWILGIVVGIVLFKLTGPKIAGTGPRLQNLRIQTLGWGFIPLFGFNILVSLITFGIYKAATAGKVQRQSSLNASLSGTSLNLQPPPVRENTTGTAGGSNPFL